MTERCPLSDGNAPGFRYGGEFSPICMQTCESLWDQAVKSGPGEFDVYPDHSILEETIECDHPATVYSHDALQATSVGAATRYYTTVDICQTCETEGAETIYNFTCPNP